MSNGLVNPNGNTISATDPEAQHFQPGTYVYYKGTLVDGQIHGRDLFLVVDPAWIGLAPMIGKTMVICAMPYYDRNAEDKGQNRVPAMVADLETLVPMESLMAHERDFLAQGGVIADPSRFKYRLMVINPMTFSIDHGLLSVVEPHHHVVVHSALRRDDLPVPLPEPMGNNENSASIYLLHSSGALPNGQTKDNNDDADDQNQSQNEQ